MTRVTYEIREAKRLVGNDFIPVKEIVFNFEFPPKFHSYHKEEYENGFVSAVEKKKMFFEKSIHCQAGYRKGLSFKDFIEKNNLFVNYKIWR